MNIRAPRLMWLSLLTLALVVVAAAVQVGVPAYRQSLALATIRRLGGSYRATPRGPEWLRERLGERWSDLVDEVDTVFVTTTDDCDDVDIARICWLTNLKVVGVRGRKITDSGISFLAKLDHLEAMTLERVHITESGLQDVGRMPHLTALTIGEVAITDGGLEPLKKLTKLQYLRLYKTQVTDAGVGELKRTLPGLTIER